MIVRTMATDPLAALDASDEERQQHIVAVLVDAFDDLIDADPRAFRRKFRKMAADPFAFYRGSAPLFYADVERLEDPWVDEATSRVWIQGDLHAENYGTYMDSAGRARVRRQRLRRGLPGPLHVGPPADGRLARAAGLRQGALRRHDPAPDRDLRDRLRGDGADVRHDGRRPRLPAHARQHRGGAARRAGGGAAGDARADARPAHDARPGDRRFAIGPGARELDEAERAAVLEAYEGYLDTIPAAKRQHSISYAVKDVVGRTGFGIGSAGLRAYNLLVEGRTQALENDVVLSMKQAQVPAPSRVVRDDRIRACFEHEGHRTAVSQHALQAHADPWVGWCELGGVGQVIKELSPYEADLDWGAVTEPDEMLPLLRDLGRATAKVHCVSDAGSEHPLVDVEVEGRITAMIGDRAEAFAADLADFGAAYGALTRQDHRRFVDAFRNGMIPGVPAD